MSHLMEACETGMRKIMNTVEDWLMRSHIESRSLLATGLEAFL